MADFGGGIPGQVLGELEGIVKDSAKAVVDAGVDILMPQAPTQSGEGKSQEAGQMGNDPMAVIKQQKATAAKRRLEEVRVELQAYYEEQKRKEKQEEQVAEEQKKEEVQIKESRKKQEEKQVLGRLSRQYGGTGEVGKSGY